MTPATLTPAEKLVDEALAEQRAKGRDSFAVPHAGMLALAEEVIRLRVRLSLSEHSKMTGPGDFTKSPKNNEITPTARTGAALLAAHLKATNTTQTEAGEALGVSHSSVSHWLAEKRCPSPSMRELIAAWSGGAVPASAWAPERDIAFAARLRRLKRIASRPTSTRRGAE